ncbi:MAG: MFS transporter [Actinomycetota bacterium]
MVEVDGSELGIPPLRRNRDFQIFWSSQVFSTLGTAAIRVAFPLLVLAETGSAASAGLVGFAQTLPFLLWFLPAGALVDRLDRKRLMIGAEVVRFAAMAAVVFLLATDRFSLWAVMLAVFVEGTALVFFELSEAAALPHLVPATQLPTAIAQNQGRQQAANLIGPPLGGVLFGLAPSLPFGFDAATYALSFIALLSIRPDFQDDRADHDTTLWSDIVHGLGWLWHQAFLRTLSIVVAAWNFMLAALILTLVVRTQDLGGGPEVVGLVSAAFGIGAMGGVFVAPRIERALPGRIIVLGATGLWAVSLVALAVAPNPLVLGCIVTAAGATAPVFQVMVGRYRYALTPDELQGRMLSASRVIGWGAIPLGSMVAGFAIDAIGPPSTMLALAALMAVAVTGSAIAPSLRRDPLAAG